MPRKLLPEIAIMTPSHREGKSVTPDTSMNPRSCYLTMLFRTALVLAASVGLPLVVMLARDARNAAALAAIGSLAAGLGILALAALLSPLRRLSDGASALARGELDAECLVFQHRHDTSDLSQALRDVAAYCRQMTDIVRRIGQGDFQGDITPRSDHDELGLAFQQMTAYLRERAACAAALGSGQLADDACAPLRERQTLPADALGQALDRILDEMRGIIRVADSVAGGDLRGQANAHSETGIVDTALATMLASLRAIVADIRREAGLLLSMGRTAHERAREDAESVEKMSLAVEETSSAMTEMAMSIGEVHHTMQGLASFIGETSSSIEEMTSSIRQIVRHSDQLTAASEETSVSIEEISASLQQFAKTAHHSRHLTDTARQDAVSGRDAVEKMIQSMLAIQVIASETTEAIQSLYDRTESIQDILAVIKDISDQTSLLAINASIIAKKAGEHGRGFRVIAEKVRALAERSNASAKEIVVILRAVRKEAAQAVDVVSLGHKQVDDGVKLAEQAGKALEQIIAGANESSSVAALIANTTTEQTQISRRIMESMEQVLEIVEHIKQATKEQEKSSAYIMKQSEQILLASEQVKTATSEQSKVVTHVTLTMDDVRTLIQMTAKRSDESAQAASALAGRADALQRLLEQLRT